MIIKISTSCNFVGSETEHYIKVPDDMSEEDIMEIVNDMVFIDIAPEGSYEEISEEDLEEEDLEIEGTWN